MKLIARIEIIKVKPADEGHCCLCRTAIAGTRESGEPVAVSEKWVFASVLAGCGDTLELQVEDGHRFPELAGGGGVS